MPLLYNIPAGKAWYLVIDVALVLSLWFVMGLVPGGPAMQAFESCAGWPVALAVVFYIICFYFFQVYRVLWRYAGLRDYARIVYAGALSGGVTMVLVLATDSGHAAAPVMHGVMVTALCSFYRLLQRRLGAGKGASNTGRKIIVVGAGEAGRLIVTEFQKRKLGSAVAAFADDDREKIGRIINGKIVRGPLDRLPDLVAEYGATEIIVAMPSVAAARTGDIVGRIKGAHPDVTVNILPPITRIFDDLPLIPDLMDSALSSLLEREEFDIDRASIEGVFAGKTILITGAGGSIGSELCKQVLKFGVARLVALGKGEHSIYTARPNWSFAWPMRAIP
jgi:FlaA1/EpsC-like NDP-sugar epimerase